MALRVLLDTNRLTDVLTGDQRLTATIEAAEQVWLPFIALAEIKCGFLAGTKWKQNEASLRRFLSLPGVDVLYADRETTEVYARLFYQLRRAGTPIPTNDLWIASLAVQHQLILLTRDKHFRDVLPGGFTPDH